MRNRNENVQGAKKNYERDGKNGNNYELFLIDVRIEKMKVCYF